MHECVYVHVHVCLYVHILHMCCCHNCATWLRGNPAHSRPNQPLSLSVTTCILFYKTYTATTATTVYYISFYYSCGVLYHILPYMELTGLLYSYIPPSHSYLGLAIGHYGLPIATTKPYSRKYWRELNWWLGMGLPYCMHAQVRNFGRFFFWRLQRQAVT